MTEKPDVFEFKEPYKNYPLLFQVISVDSLEVVPYQRKPSKGLVANIRGSVQRFGFVVPLVVSKSPKGKKYLILDGQHRFLAAKEVGLSSLPCVVVPPELATKMMNLNIEKQPSIREKAYVAIRIYQSLLEENDKIPENDEQVLEAIELPYFITLGYAYEQRERFAGSAYDSLLSRVDFFLETPLKEAANERKKRADKLLTVDDSVKQIVAKLKEMGKFHPFIYKEIVSFANPLKMPRGRRKKKESFDFHESMDALLKNLTPLVKDPAPLIKKIGKMEFFE